MRNFNYFHKNHPLTQTTLKLKKTPTYAFGSQRGVNKSGMGVGVLTNPYLVLTFLKPINGPIVSLGA